MPILRQVIRMRLEKRSCFLIFIRSIWDIKHDRNSWNGFLYVLEITEITRIYPYVLGYVSYLRIGKFGNKNVKRNIHNIVKILQEVKFSLYNAELYTT